MAENKITTNLEFDVIYADGTRRHVNEGILFGVENERIIFHNGTDRPEVIVAVAEATAGVIGSMEFPEDIVSKILFNIIKNITHAEVQK